MESAHLTLELLNASRIPEIFEAIGTEPDVYRWLPFARPENLEGFTKVLNTFIEETSSGKRVAHSVILKSTGKAIGTTSFLDLNPTHNSLEIGSTFYSKDYWRTFVNTECKLIMLTEAFEVRSVERVTLKTDSLNQRSRDAISRLGANFEGLLRHHMKRPDGSWRDSAYFSILQSEWPSVQADLMAKLDTEAKR